MTGIRDTQNGRRIWLFWVFVLNMQVVCSSPVSVRAFRRQNTTTIPRPSFFSGRKSMCHLKDIYWNKKIYKMLLMEEILHQIGSLYNFLQGFVHPRWWSPGFWTINSSSFKNPGGALSSHFFFHFFWSQPPGRWSLNPAAWRCHLIFQQIPSPAATLKNLRAGCRPFEVMWNNEINPGFCWGFIGDEIVPSYMGIIK